MRARDAAINALPATLPISSNNRKIYCTLCKSLFLFIEHANTPTQPSLHLVRARRVGLFQFEEGVNISGNPLYMGTYPLHLPICISWKVKLAAYFASFNFAPKIGPFCKVEIMAGILSNFLQRPIRHLWWGPCEDCTSQPLALARQDSLLVSSWGGHKYHWEQPLRALYGQPPQSKEITLSSLGRCQYTSVLGTYFSPKKKLSPHPLSFPGQRLVLVRFICAKSQDWNQGI